MSIELSDGTILLRPFRTTDLVPVHEAILGSFVELSRWMWWCHAEYSLDDTSAFISLRKKPAQLAKAYSESALWQAVSLATL